MNYFPEIIYVYNSRGVQFDSCAYYSHAPYTLLSALCNVRIITPENLHMLDKEALDSRGELQGANIHEKACGIIPRRICQEIIGIHFSCLRVI